MGCPITITTLSEPPTIGAVLNKVDAQMARAQDLGQTAIDAIGDIGEAIGRLNEVNLPDINPPAVVAAPNTSGIGYVMVEPGEFTMPAEPQAPVLGLTQVPEVPDAPGLEVDEVAIDLNIAKPSALSAMVPAEPGLPPVTIPQSPDIVLPALPSFSGVSVPAIPTIDLPVFTAELDDLPVAPDPSFEWAESPYSSPLLDDLQYWLSVWVAGAATGLDPNVERAIWDRGRDREAATFGQAANQVLNDMAGRGFPMPPGAAAMMIADAGMRMRSQVATFNRDVAIKQAELEQQNRQFALAKAWDVQQGLINYASQQSERALQAAKYAVEAAIEVYKAMVLRYNAQVEAFKARAEVFRAQLQAELAKLEVFRSQIEAARLTVELDKAQVDLYRAQVEGVRALIAVYEGQVNAARVQADIAKTVVDTFKAKVDAYKAQVDAKDSEFRSYEAEIRAEVSKIDIVKARADILNARANAYAATVRGKVDLTNIAAEINERIPLESFRARVQAYTASVQASAAEAQSVTAATQAQVQAFSASATARVGMANVDAQVFDSSVRQSIGIAAANADAAKARADVAVRLATERIEAVRSAAQVTATLAAGAMAGVNVHAGANGSASMSNGMSVNYSQSSICTTSGD